MISKHSHCEKVREQVIEGDDMRFTETLGGADSKSKAKVFHKEGGDNPCTIELSSIKIHDSGFWEKAHQA